MDTRTRNVLLAGVIAVLVLLGLHGANKLLLGDGPWLAIDSEQSVATWYSVTNFFAAGAAGLLMAVADRRRSRWWLLVGLMFVAFGVDDAVGVHEATEDASNDLSRLVLQPAVTCVGCGLLVGLARLLDRVPRLCLYLGAALFAAGIAASLVASYLVPPHAIYVALMYLEESSEMLMATTTVAAAVATRFARPTAESAPDARPRAALVHSAHVPPTVDVPARARRRLAS